LTHAMRSLAVAEQGVEERVSHSGLRNGASKFEAFRVL
jgi:hypothetical protein